MPPDGLLIQGGDIQVPVLLFQIPEAVILKTVTAVMGFNHVNLLSFNHANQPSFNINYNSQMLKEQRQIKR